MVTRSIIDGLLAESQKLGADFAEVFIEETRTQKLQLLDKSIKEITGGIDYGIGIRLVQNEQVYYAHTNDDSESGLRTCLKQAACLLKPAAKTNPLSDIIASSPALVVRPQKKFTDIPLARKADLLLRADAAARAARPTVSQVNANYMDQTQTVRIINSQGLDFSDTRDRCRFQITAVAASGTENQTGSESPGARRGFEFFETLDIETLAKQAAERAHLMLSSEYCPSGAMPVIIDKGFGGVIFHEACGHGLESYSIVRDSSVFGGKLNSAIASPLVSAVDDGTLDHEWGSLSHDDEGTPTERTLLIENGILKTYMCDRLGAKKLGLRASGSARRESYQYAPVSRMRNTFILPGKSTVEEMIANTDYGLYAKYLGGGSVNTTTGEFNFAVTEGYLIRNGRIEKPVRGATLIGRGLEVLQLIDHVGDELGLAQGMCGASSGWVPVNVGQPALRVSRLTVGGR